VASRVWNSPAEQPPELRHRASRTMLLPPNRSPAMRQPHFRADPMRRGYKLEGRWLLAAREWRDASVRAFRGEPGTYVQSRCICMHQSLRAIGRARWSVAG
jgi:hypothetical protein